MLKKLPIIPSAKANSMVEAPSGIVWREQHPVISGKCNQCLICTLYCPEGALVSEKGKVDVNQNICNGCGTCGVECPQKAIDMIPEFTGDRGIFPLKEAKS